jgi:hypothetical protein
MRKFTALVAAAALAMVAGVAMAEETKPADIVDTAVAAGKFKTLVTAVKEAGLVETLKGKGPFTVFAPPTRRSPRCRKSPAALPGTREAVAVLDHASCPAACWGRC